MKTSPAIFIAATFIGAAVAFNVSVLSRDPMKNISSLIPATYPSETTVPAQQLNSAVIPTVIPVQQKKQEPSIPVRGAASSSSSSSLATTSTSVLQSTTTEAVVNPAPIVTTIQPNVTTAAPTTQAPTTTAPTKINKTTTTTISPMPAGCIKGVLEDNGRWNCQNDSGGRDD